jgi:O-antigen/teichoic acid export membrane protein
MPEDFGLVALAVSFIALIDTFGQFGVEVALIQNQRAERRHYDSAWTINLITASVVSLVLVLLASRAALFFEESRVEAIIYWLAAGNVVRAFENIGVVDFRKRLEFDREFRYLFSARVLSTIVTLIFAFYWREYWALVAGTLAQAVIRVGLSYLVHEYRPGFSLAGLGDMFHFSKWVLAQNVMHSINERASALVIGKMSSAESLAHYSNAYEISNLATTELAAPIRRAIFPGFSKMASDTMLLRDGYIKTFAVIVWIGLPIPVGIALTAPLIVSVFLGYKWVAAVPLIQVLALYGVLRTLGTSSHLVYLALGKPRITAIFSALRLFVLIPLLIWGTRQGGAIGAAWAMVVSAALLWGVDFAILLRVLKLDLGDLLGATWRAIVAVLAMFLIVYCLRLSLPVSASFLSSASQLAAIIAIGAATYVAASLMLWRACGRPQGAESMVLATLRRSRVLR